jgi:hypothetical protein
MLLNCVPDQVDQAQGVFNEQLLLQLETDLLLSLMMMQLTASIPDSTPGAQAARDAACLLCGGPLHGLWRAARLHKMPEPDAWHYTGPQALQLLPFPVDPQPPAPLQSQQ